MANDEKMQNVSRLLELIGNEKEVFWRNRKYLPFEYADERSKYSLEDVKDAEARLQRFSDFIKVAYPETEEADGIIESGYSALDNFVDYFDEKYKNKVGQGKFLLKRDDSLPISGTIKARGAIYEVLKHAEDLAIANGLLAGYEDDYSKFATDEFRDFFATRNITVGTTGNLGISVGYMGRKLGFDVTVHMSEEAKDWKKQYLRDRGVNVVEHSTNFTLAVEQGRAASEEDPNSYFVDDEHSEELFYGYMAGGYRVKRQLEEQGITVDQDHPLFLYLPCGIGGSPGGITFGIKQALGDNVHCFFAEPTKMPSMLLGMTTQKFDTISVEEIDLGGLTVADGLAVPRTSGIIAKALENFFSGGYTLRDETFSALQYQLKEKEDIFVEPAGCAGLVGPWKLLNTKYGREYIIANQLEDKMENATHIAWATGGSMVPESDREEFLKNGKEANETAVFKGTI